MEAADPGIVTAQVAHQHAEDRLDIERAGRVVRLSPAADAELRSTSHAPTPNNFPYALGGFGSQSCLI
jgi:hypothetical protein